MDDKRPDSPAPAQAPRAPWVPPTVTDLPRLTNLTLVSGIGGGESVFP